ncbi:MAG: RIP metalloprotease RseP [Verrucomicrobia bacterium]|nr:RIP metalloprotease RseP [Verrucomicrobiota bacterium]
MLETIFIVAMMLFLFGITIFVHEFGHFIVARKCGLVVETFSIGMGPALWKKEVGGIVYKIGAFPIGGYVSLPQLDPEGMEKMQGENEGDRKTMPNISPWKKIAVSVAGPLFNIAFALPLAFLVTFTEPMPDHTAVGAVATNSVAYAEGLRASDEILKVNGTPVVDWYGIISEDLLAQDNETVSLLVRSGSETHSITIPSKSTQETMLPAMRPLLAQITAKDPAGVAGLKTGDLVTQVGGKPILWWHELSDSLQDYDGKQTTITVLRSEKTITMDITPKYRDDLEKVIIGVTPGDPGMLPWTMEGSPIEQVRNDASKIGRLFKALGNKKERGSAAKMMGGPIAIFTLLWFALKLGFLYAIGFIRFININLAVLNLLPIPVLDGGHICFALWEGITKRKVHPKVVSTLINIFAILLITLFLFLSWRDVDRNWNVSRFFKKAPVEQVESPVED